MANAWYEKGLQNVGDGLLIFISATMKVIGTHHATVTPNVSTHDALDDISAGTVFTSGALASKSNTNGLFDAADITITAVSGSSIESITVYKDTGTPATSWLMTYYDTGTGFPLTPNGGDITVAWDNGTNKIAQL